MPVHVCLYEIITSSIILLRRYATSRRRISQLPAARFCLLKVATVPWILRLFVFLRRREIFECED
jgi:hypothetical protein